MKIAIVTKFNNNPTELKKKLKEFDFTYTVVDPDIVISEGGDGTLLIAERKYPGIPKLVVKRSRICKTCITNLSIEEMLKRIKTNEFKIAEHTKLQLKTSTGERLTCTNDFILRNKIPIQALRFILNINNQQLNDVFIGDGLVFATPFGSSAYFHSITNEEFSNGFGLAFNNITENRKWMKLKDSDEVKVKIIRGPAQLGSDNNKRILTLNTGDFFTVSKSKHNLKVITF